MNTTSPIGSPPTTTPPPDRPNPPAGLALALIKPRNDGAGWPNPLLATRVVGHCLGESQHEARDMLDARVSSKESWPHDHRWSRDDEVAANGPRASTLYADFGIQLAEELPGRRVEARPR